MLQALVLGVGLFLAITVIRKLRQYYALKDFGGPWSVGFSRLWLLWANGSGKMNIVFTKVNDTYGPTARVAPHMLITKDADLYRKMHAVRSPFTRSEWYTALRLHPTRDNITSYTNEAVHSDIRTRMAPGYSGKENLHVEKDVDDQLLALFGLIEDQYLSTDSSLRPADLGQILTYFTLDVISKVAFGQAFGFVEANEDPYGYIANLQEFLPAIIVFGAYTELQKILRLPFMKAIMPNSSDKRGLGRVMGFAKERVAERFGDKPVVRKDMLGSFIKRGLGQEELESETLTQITAGSDSTASALRMTLYFITTNPAVQDRLLAEINDAVTAGRITRPVIKDTEARQLPYLQACIKEGLRMYPPVTGLLCKEVPEEGTHIDGKFAPGGTWIAWNSWGMQRDKETFGVDAEMFRPERWFPKNCSASERARVERMTETVGLVFGYGRFGCLGRGIAMMELNKGIIETLLRFNLQTTNPISPFIERCVGFFLHTDMFFRITRRDKDVQSAADAHLNGDASYMAEVAALPGAQEE